MVLHLFNVRCCGILLGQCLLKVGCLLNGVQQELHFNVTFSCSHLLAKLYPVFGPQTSVKDRGMARAIVNGHEQQNSMKAQQLQASTHYHVSNVFLKPHVL